MSVAVKKTMTAVKKSPRESWNFTVGAQVQVRNSKKGKTVWDDGIIEHVPANISKDLFRVIYPGGGFESCEAKRLRYPPYQIGDIVQRRFDNMALYEEFRIAGPCKSPNDKVSAFVKSKRCYIPQYYLHNVNDTLAAVGPPNLTCVPADELRGEKWRTNIFKLLGRDPAKRQTLKYVHQALEADYIPITPVGKGSGIN